MSLLIGFVALLIERVMGYPASIQNRIGHPVQWMGALIDWFDDNFNRENEDGFARRRAGIFMLVALMGVTFFITASLSAILRDLPLGWIVEALLAVPFLASKQLGETVRKVAAALDLSLEEGRAAVGKIVGRDTGELDQAEISRAAIETLAENTSDGVIAPLFWLVIFGLPGITLYKAINTADSMVGHMSDRHRDFGWASARLDDLVNWLPARLTALLFAGAAYFVSDASPEDAWETARHDAPNHTSPNAGWPEAALAGALDFGLGGPRTYRGEMLDLPQMGAGRRNLGPEDITQAVRFYNVTIWLTIGVVGGLAVLAALLG